MMAKGGYSKFLWTLVVADTKGVIQIAGIHITML